MSIASPITTADLAATLRASTHSDVVTPDDSSYAAAIFGLSASSECRPELVVIVASAVDAAATMRLAARAGRRVVAELPGRNAVIIDGPGTILIVTRLLASVRIDPAAGTAIVGAGATWRQVLAAGEPFGLTAVSGPVPGFGAVGHTVHGGRRSVARSFGFALDHVRAFELVTAGGELVTVDAGTDPELFRSLRRGATSGLVTAMTISLVPIGRTYVGGLWFAEELADAALAQWHQWSADLPNTVSASIGRLHLPDSAELPAGLRGRSVVHLRFAHVGDPAEGARVLAPMRDTIPVLLDGVRVPLASWSVVDAEPECVGR
jgi:FAD/FMN-containing dehydrogenase